MNILANFRKKSKHFLLFFIILFEPLFWVLSYLAFNLFDLAYTLKQLVGTEPYREFNQVELTLNIFREIITAIFWLGVPSVFKLTFGDLPLIYFFKKTLKKYEQLSPQEMFNPNLELNNQAISEAVVSKSIISNINESKKISENIFSRAGVYLLVGCFIAFTGIYVFSSFYSLTLIFPYETYVPKKNYNLLDDVTIPLSLTNLIPRFGALFFIEFIAFFFLKQYRVLMEEFRYYEAIKRKRQEQLTLIELVEIYKDKPDILKLIIDTTFTIESKKLLNGESTEILETQKILNQELDIFGKITDLVNAIKSK